MISKIFFEIIPMYAMLKNNSNKHLRRDTTKESASKPHEYIWCYKNSDQSTQPVPKTGVQRD